MTSSNGTTSYDAVVIGGGHNGLVAAAMLGRAGRRVILIEARDVLGGGAGAHVFHPGYKVSSLAHLMNRFAPEVERALGLDLADLGKTLAPTVALDPVRGPVVLDGAYGESLSGVAADEAGRFAALRALLMSQADILARFLARPPPMPGDLSVGDALDLGKAGLALLKRGRSAGRDFARMLLTNIADVVDEHLDDDRLKGLLAFDATLGIHLGPRSPTSIMGLYYRLAGSCLGARGGQIIPRGGMGAVTAHLASAARKAGVEIRTGVGVAAVTTERGRVAGIVLDCGERIAAPLVVSAIHPVTTLRSLLPPGAIDIGLDRAVSHIRSRGDAAKLHLALDAVPAFVGVPAEAAHGRLVVAPSVDHVERAFNPAKYCDFSPEPVMEITLPSLTDPTIAPPGGAVLSAIVQYAPYDLRGGWDSRRDAFLETVLATLERHAPGLRASIVGAELLLPPDIEARFGMPGGHWHHGELQVDQMIFNRPAFGVSGYDTPVPGLYLASSGSHPGGGISGLPGYNAARRALAKETAA